MSIIKLRPSFKDYLWGGQKLKEVYAKDTDLNPLAESWEVSTHPNGPSYVLNGEYAGLTLAEYLEKKDYVPLGEKHRDGKEVPVLIKFIDSLLDLSIQVHPNDKYSLKYEGVNGKTEMWYILEAEPDAKIYYGTKSKMTSEDFKQSIKDNTILNKLKHVSVKKDDVVFVGAGTIHAIGAGIILCEIQQNSNITYRIFDFNRKDIGGNLRELHVDKALEVVNLDPLDTEFKAQAEVVKYEHHTRQLLVTCPYFTTSKIQVLGDFILNVSKDSFKAIVVIEGEVIFTDDNEKTSFTKGESGFFDADNQNIKVSGNGKYLAVTI